MRHIVIASTIVAALALSLPGCGRSKQRVSGPEATPASSVTANADHHYQQALAAWEKWQASEGCSGPERNAFIAAIGRLKDESSRWNAVEENFPREAWVARERHASAAFAFADESAERGCHADAERMYRHLMEFYAGSVQAGIRDRASLGVDQVQAAQGVAEVSPE